MKRNYDGNSNKSGIYVIYCYKNFGVYVGSSLNMKKRAATHSYLLRGNKHHCIHLQNAWNKYGEDAFVFKVIETCERETRLELEQSYIDIHFGKVYCYNTHPIAQFRKTIKPPKTKEALKKIYSRKKSDVERKKISQTRKAHLKIRYRIDRNYDKRLQRAIDCIFDRGLYPRDLDCVASEIPWLTIQAREAYKRIPNSVTNNREKTLERQQRKHDFKDWCFYQGLLIDKRTDSWKRKSDKDKKVALFNLSEGRKSAGKFERY